MKPSERRHRPTGNLALQKGVAIPVDYCAAVKDALMRTFAEGFDVLRGLKKNPTLDVSGLIFPNEITMTLSFGFTGQLSATTIHASTDFDPKASHPKAEDLLGFCVDALGNLIAQYLDPKRADLIEKFSSESMSAFDDVPFTWTAVTVAKRNVYLKVDKTNPKLEKMADDFLEKNDPTFFEREAVADAERERAVEKQLKEKLGDPAVKPPTKSKH